MLDLSAHPSGVLLRVRALPGAKRNELRGEQDGALKVSVTQIAEKGKANKAIRDVLVKSLGLSKSQVELIGGFTSGQKTFLCRQHTVDSLRAKIDAALAE